MIPRITPEALVEKYHHIEVVPPVGHPVFVIQVRSYRSESPDCGGAEAGIAFKEVLRSAARHLNPPVDTNNRGLPFTVTGRAGPSQFRFVFELLARILVERPREFADLHLPAITNLPRGITDEIFLRRLNNSALGLQERLQLIADCLMGLDCDGFVGNYLYFVGAESNQFRATTRAPNQFVRNPRDFVSDPSSIRRYMVIQWPNNLHVAIISRPVLPPRTWIVCEATGDNRAGIRSAAYTITAGPPGRFTVHRPENSCSNCTIGSVGLESLQVP